MHVRKQGFSENFDAPVFRNERLKSLLPLWKESRYWHINESRSQYLSDQNGSKISQSGAMLWANVIKLSQFGYTTTQSDWVLQHSHIPLPRPLCDENEDEPQQQWSTVGPRLAWYTPKPSSWVLVVDPAQATESIEFYVNTCKEHFRDVSVFNNLIYACIKLSTTFHDDASILCSMANQDERPAQLRRIWTIACALHCEAALVEMLPSVARQKLSSLLLEELRSAAPSLTLHNDIALELFSGHASDKVDEFSSRITRSRPAGRLGDMLHAHDAWNTYFPRTDFEDQRDYYNVVARTIILACDKAEISQCLRLLPAGRTFLHAIETIQDNKPWVLVSLLNDTTYFVEGIFGLLTLPIHRPDGPTDLTEEHHEVQQLLRFHIIGSTHPYYIQESIVLGLHDENEYLNHHRSRYPNISVQIEERKNHHSKLLQPWHKMLNLEPGPIAFLTDALCKHLDMNNELSITDISFSVRILANVKDAIFRSQLCRSIVNSYFVLLNSKNLSIKFTVPTIDGQPMMRIFGKCLRESENKDSWQVWITVSHELANSLSGIDENDDTQIRQQFSLRDKLSSHLNNLILQLPSLDDEAVSQIVDLVLRIYETEKRCNMHYGLFSWTSGLIEPLSNESSNEPFLVQLAKHASKLDRIGVVILDRIKASNPSALEIAQLLWGLHGNVHLTDLLSEGLSDIVKQDLKQQHAIGYLKLITIAMYRAGSYDEAYLYASELLRIVENNQNHVVWEYKLLALLIMLAILVSKDRFSDALLINVPQHDANRDRYCNFQNLRALAFIGMQDFDAARVHLDNVLKICPNNPAALCNLVFLHLRNKQWQAVIIAARQAREQLGDECPSSVTQYEIVACWECGEKQRVARLLEQLPSNLDSEPSIWKVRTGLLLSALADKSELEQFILYLDKEDPKQASELRAQLAATGRRNFLDLSWLVGLPRGRVPLAERLGGDPEKYLDDSFAQCCEMLAGRPDLGEALSEDQLTLMLIWLYQPLLGMGIRMRAHPESGHGPSRGGIADFEIESVDSFQMPRVLVRGEAKKWDGLDTVDQGIRQVFGTSNTYSEIFLSVVVYYLGNDYSDCINKMIDFLPKFVCVQEGLATYKCIKFEQIKNRKAPVVTFRSIHRVSESNLELYPDRILYTYVIDMKTSIAKGLRVSSAKSGKGTAGVAGKPKRSSSAKSSIGTTAKGGPKRSSS